jgi:alpha-mannosidase
VAPGQALPGDELTEAWKKITFNDFHDLAAVLVSALSTRKRRKDYDDVRWATNEISQQSFKTLAPHEYSVAGGVPVAGLNPLAWERSGPVTVDVQMPEAGSGGVTVLDASNHVVPSQVIKSDAKTNSYKLLVARQQCAFLGYTRFCMSFRGRSPLQRFEGRGSDARECLAQGSQSIRTGCITSLYDKKTKFETLAAGGCGNQLQTFKDLPKDYDAWNIDPGTLDHFTPDRQGRFRRTRWKRPAARHSRDAYLAELEVCPGHHARRRRGSGGCGERYRLA